MRMVERWYVITYVSGLFLRKDFKLPKPESRPARVEHWPNAHMLKINPEKGKTKSGGVTPPHTLCRRAARYLTSRMFCVT